MNHQAIEISGTEIPVIEYKGERVITFENIDRVHQRPEGTARKRFNDNKNRFIENEDFFNVPYEEWSEILCVRNSDAQNKRLNFMRFITEHGYPFLVKLFTDDLAWEVAT